jgi:hypothetical protein
MMLHEVPRAKHNSRVIPGNLADPSRAVNITEIPESKAIASAQVTVD